ncbi:MAG TPA: NAD(P)H-binding protein [Ohtaekwangia sp.]|uniref:NmrA family NAD(P)-binding protein n=1 Tax=Ohtaekwangia sp. TaxID=2066019 RepID=UPI002F93EDD5
MKAQTHEPARTVKSQAQQPVLVIGGNGKTGKRIVQQLSELHWPVKAASRSCETRFDWHDINTWKPALQGMHAVYISFQPDLAVPGSIDAIRQLVKIASETDIQKLVLLSGRGEEEAEKCEHIVINSGIDWTILRASWFCQNFSEGFFLEPLQANHFALPIDNIAEPFIDTDDIADVAIAALTEDGHSKKLYELTGPRLLTFREATEEIGKAIGRIIRYEQISLDEYTAMLKNYNVPQEYIRLMTYLFTEVLDGRNQSVKDGVQQALGRKPTDFSEYVRKTAATGIWG